MRALVRCSALAVGLAIAFEASTTAAIDRFVAVGGSDVSSTCASASFPCQTIQKGIRVAGPGDTVKVAAGFYDQHASLAAALDAVVVEGSWNPDFSARLAVPSTVMRGTARERYLTIVSAGFDVDLSFDRFAFEDGDAGHEQDGGALRFEARNGGNAKISLVDCEFRDNLAAHHGGAIYAIALGGSSVTLEVSDSLFLENVANASASPQNGGAISVIAQDAGSEGSVVLARNQFLGNEVQGFTSPTRGGAVYLAAFGGASLEGRLVNDVFASNLITGGMSSGGSAFFVESDSSSTATVVARNETITDNMVFRAVGADGPALVMLRNTILWDNPGGNVIEYGGGEVVIDHSDVLASSGYTDGGGNVEVDPSFVDPAAGDYHLAETSDLIDAGICREIVCLPPPIDRCIDVPVAPPDDFDGDLRPQGVECDIGADEVLVPEPGGLLSGAVALCTLAGIRGRRSSLAA